MVKALFAPCVPAAQERAEQVRALEAVLHVTGAPLETLNPKHLNP